MKGKIALVVGLGAGYVLGTRAGRERFEQIRTQWDKLWNLDPVQQQVGKVQEFAKSQASTVPGAVWNGAVKAVKAVSGSGSAGEKLDGAIDATKDAADKVSDAGDDKKSGASGRGGTSGSGTGTSGASAGSGSSSTTGSSSTSGSSADTGNAGSNGSKKSDSTASGTA